MPTSQLSPSSQQEEAEFRQQNLVKHFNHIFDNSKDVVNLFSFTQQKVIAQNKPSYESTGYSLKDLETTPITQFYPPEELPKLFATLEKLVQEGAVEERLKMYFCDGSLRDIWVRSFIIQREPELLALVHTIDLTEETRKAEQALKAAKLATLGEVNALLAHEIKNAIQAIQSSFFLLADDKTSYLSDFGQERIKSGQQTLAHMESVIRNVGHYLSSSTSGTSTLSVAAVVKGAVDFLGGYLASKDITVAIDIPENFSFIKADPSQMQQILVNLIKNSAQAMTISLSKKVDIIADKNSAGAPRLTIRDSGAGISEAMKNRLFDAFATNKGADSFGLGLAIVSRFCAANSIKISFDSVAGVGTEFHLLLPAAQVNKVNGLDAQAISEAVLFISESPLVKDLAKQLEEKKGIPGVLASTPSEASAILAAQSIGLVLCDASLYPVSGEKLAAELAKSFSGPICVIYTEKKAANHNPGKTTEGAGAAAHAGFPRLDMAGKSSDVMINELIKLASRWTP